MTEEQETLLQKKYHNKAVRIVKDYDFNKNINYVVTACLWDETDRVLINVLLLL